MEKPKILVVGSMNMDVMIYGAERIPSYGETVMCQSYQYIPGGKGANQAMAAALQGGAVTMVGRVGDDIDGNTLVERLEEEGINTRFVFFDHRFQTGFDPIIVDDTGKYVSYGILGANGGIQHEQVKEALDTAEFDMVLLQFEMPSETIYKTIEYARIRKIPVFLDAGPVRPIDLKLLREIMIISPNETEIKALTGIKPDSDKKALLAVKNLYAAVNPRYVILKLGERGALVYNGKKAYTVPAFVVKAVDSTAAGDTFGAALAVQLCQGVEMKKAVRYANAAAAICVSRKGAQTAIPNAEETTVFLAQNENGREHCL